MNNFTIDYHTKCSLTGLSFEYLNKSGIRKISVKEIKSPFALDRLLNPVPNGLYDLALGPLDKNDVCLTCHLDYFKCPGHFGHIDLALPVYNPIFFKGISIFITFWLCDIYISLNRSWRAEFRYVSIFILGPSNI